MSVLKPLEMAKTVIKDTIRPGETVIDATAGNGHDTVMLAELVGAEGKVWAFDIQEQALQNTRSRLAAHGLLQRVELVHGSHGEAERIVPAPVAAAMFNLGYLPGGDHSIITTPAETIGAIAGILRLLRPGGVITVMIYTGHPGGAEEGKMVTNWAAGLSQREYDVYRYEPLNQRGTPPFMLIFQKKQILF